jgi:hypothetical protein
MVAAEFDTRSFAHRIIIGHAQYQAMIMVDEVSLHERNQGVPLVFTGEIVGKAYVDRELKTANFRMFDMDDARNCEHEIMHELRALEPHELFPQSAKAGEDGLIVLPNQETVDEVLDLLLEKQAPRQQEIRQNEARRQRQHAAIITLEDVA